MRGAEVLALLKSVLLQQPLAETVDREDRRLIEMVERGLQRIGVLAQGSLERLAQAYLEVAGRLFGEGDQQDAVERGAGVDQQAQHELLDPVGLPRPRGGLDHCMPAQVDCLNGQGVALAL